MKLDVKNLRKTFKNHVGLEQTSFFIPECRTLAVIGPSGGGKSTLLRLIAGLDIPDSGTISIDDRDLIFEESFLLQHRRSLGVVFQSFNLFPHLTILQNIELPLHQVHGLSEQEASERSLELLTRFGLQNHMHKKPYHLSGGQRQRAAIIRAVAIRSKLLLLDEPTSALDPLMTSEVLDLIMELRKEGGVMILVSHHLSFVKKIADWVVFLDSGQVLEYAPVHEFFSSPKTDSAKRFLEKVLKY